MKKHAKIIGMGMMLVLAAVLVTGCPTPNTSKSGTSGSGSSSSGGSGGSGGNPSPKPTEAVQKMYDEALEEFATELKNAPMPADVVADGIKKVNEHLASLGFHVVDKKSGTGLAQGTTVEQLKERFTLQEGAVGPGPGPNPNPGPGPNPNPGPGPNPNPGPGPNPNPGPGPNPNPGPGSQPPEVVQMQYDDAMQWLADVLKRSDFPADKLVAEVRNLNMDLSRFGWKVVDKKSGTGLAQGTTVEQLKERFTLQEDAVGPGSQPPEVVQMQYDDVMQRLADVLKRSDLPADGVVEGFRHVNMDLSRFGWKVVDKTSGTGLAQGTTVEQLKERFTLQKITE
ncbi:hypothetical protein [Treponema phagedenis]|uniref:hypothetical protein n=1 Tax=Treponema phagedenis TaxID=162 RepID=UPI00197F1822|nr:hypothetical protein [Treponema phagedenis]